MKHPKQELSYFCADLINYRFMVNLSDEHWERDLDEYQKSIISDDEALLLRFEHRRDLYAHLQNEFPQYQKRSYLTMLLAVFEDCLNQFALSLKAHLNLSDDLNSASGKGIDRARNYIFKSASLKSISDQTIWERLKKSQSVRNAIVHSAGHLDPKSKNYKKVLKIITASDSVEIEKYAREHIVITSAYLLEVISDMELFCSKLILRCNGLPNK